MYEARFSLVCEGQTFKKTFKKGPNSSWTSVSKEIIVNYIFGHIVTINVLYYHKNT